MKSLIIPLVDWGMGAVLIGVFALVCITLTLIVFSMANSDKKKDDTTNDETTPEL